MSGPFDSLDTDALSRENVPDGFQPQLAVLTDEPFSDPDWIYERKLDGVRCVIVRHNGQVRLRSRNGNDLNSAYPEIAEALEGGPDLAADGEIVAFSGNVTSFSRLQERIGLRDPDAARATGIAVYLYLFDLLNWDGWTLAHLPLRQRKAVLKRAVPFSRRIRFSPHRNTEGEAWLEEACRKGWEGLIAKRANAPYRFARSRDWLKFKCSRGQEMVIGGWTEPQGERDGFGALLLGYYEDGALRYAGRVGTGFNDEFLTAMRRRLGRLERKTPPFSDPPSGTGLHWVRPDLVGEVEFTEWTSSGKLRHPRFKGLREDKPARDVVRETERDLP